ncbi:MAG: hypothetical protein IJF65_06680 [Clostridia bacterium]|nr:hypothetical protein [Clostridia bacterium]
MTFFEAVGLLIGAALALICLSALVIWLERRIPSKRYDERQKEAQGKGYKWAFWVGMVYFATLTLANALLPDGVPMDMNFAICIGLLLQAFIFAVYCNYKGAYFPLRCSPKANIILDYILGVIFLCEGAMTVRSLGITLEENYLEVIKFRDVRLDAIGADVLAWLQMIVAVMFLVLATVQLIRYMWDQQE